MNTDPFLNQYVVTDCGETGKVVKARPRKGIEGYVIRLLVEKLFTNEWRSAEETKAAIDRYATSSKGIAVSVMVMQSGFLHWSDAVALGSANRSTHEAWKQTRDVYLWPLLGVLESMVGRKPEYDGPMCELLRFRHWYDFWKQSFDEDYDSFSVFQKCEALVVVIHAMVHSQQTYEHEDRKISLEDPSNYLVNSCCSSMNWDMGFGVIPRNSETDFLRKFHRRGTMAVTISFFGYVKRVMMTHAPDENSEGASLGRVGVSCYIKTFSLSRIFPLRDQDLTKAARDIYPTALELDILGPLVKKVVLAEPLFRWVPPDSEKDALFQDLPTPLEELSEDIIRDEGMRDWLDPEHIDLFWAIIRTTLEMNIAEADEEVDEEANEGVLDAADEEVDEEGEENTQE